jgi:hypothetical protein
MPKGRKHEATDFAVARARVLRNKKGVAMIELSVLGSVRLSRKPTL